MTWTKWPVLIFGFCCCHIWSKECRQLVLKETTIDDLEHHRSLTLNPCVSETFVFDLISFLCQTLMVRIGKEVVKILPNKFRTLYFHSSVGEICHFLGILSAKERPLVTRRGAERKTEGDLLTAMCAHGGSRASPQCPPWTSFWRPNHICTTRRGGNHTKVEMRYPWEASRD